MQQYPNQIAPNQPFDIFYFLRNPTDSTTYYIRAVIYDVRSGTVLLTANLTQLPTNSRLFSATVQAPADSSGIGRNIVAIASVYTDAGYTTKSTDYEEQEQYLLVRSIAPNFSGGAVGIDYQELRSMMREEVLRGVRALPKPEVTKMPDMPFEAIFGAIGALQREINRIPKEGADLSSVSQSLAHIHNLIASQSEPEKVELAPIEEALNGLAYDIAQLNDRLEQTETRSRAFIEQTIKSAAADLEKGLEAKFTKTIESQQLSIPVMRTVERPVAPTPTPLNIHHLMS